MISNLARSVVRFFVEQNVISENDFNVYKYGMELVLSTVVNIFIIFVIAIFSGYGRQIALFLIPFLIFRQLIGGYHAKTHIGCNALMITMLIVYISILPLIEDDLNINIIILELFISFILIYFLAPAEHPNKRLLPEDINRLRKKVLITSFIFTDIVIYLVLIKMPLAAVYISTGIFISTLVMLIGKIIYSKSVIKYKNHTKEELL